MARGICRESECGRPRAARELCSKHYGRWKRDNGIRCSFEGCGNGAHSQGLCAGHVEQRRRGRELAPLLNTPRSFCAIEECDQLSTAMRLCRKHYYRYRVNGDPNLVQIAAKGAGSRDRNGYRVLVFDGRQMPEHRWIMEQHLGRKLLRSETVHHKNGVRDDNRIENLELWSKAQPPGQRVEDKVDWAVDMLKLYAPHMLAGSTST